MPRVKTSPIAPIASGSFLPRDAHLAASLSQELGAQDSFLSKAGIGIHNALFVQCVSFQWQEKGSSPMVRTLFVRTVPKTNSWPHLQQAIDHDS